MSNESGSETQWVPPVQLPSTFPWCLRSREPEDDHTPQDAQTRDRLYFSLASITPIFVSTFFSPELELTPESFAEGILRLEVWQQSGQKNEAFDFGGNESRESFLSLFTRSAFLDSPGRADIWLKGFQLADQKREWGGFSDFDFALQSTFASIDGIVPPLDQSDKLWAEKRIRFDAARAVIMARSDYLGFAHCSKLTDLALVDAAGNGLDRSGTQWPQLQLEAGDGKLLHPALLTACILLLGVRDERLPRPPRDADPDHVAVVARLNRIVDGTDAQAKDLDPALFTLVQRTLAHIQNPQDPKWTSAQLWAAATEGASWAGRLETPTLAPPTVIDVRDWNADERAALNPNAQQTQPGVFTFSQLEVPVPRTIYGVEEGFGPGFESFPLSREKAQQLLCKVGLSG